MSDLTDLERALREDQAYARLADSHAHRAVRETSLGHIVGRDALLAEWVAGGAQTVSVSADLGEMIAFLVTAGDEQWRGHRWVRREDGRVLQEVFVEDRAVGRAAPPAHPPLGELRAGMGQYAAGETAVLPPDFSPEARPLADRLHRAWNGRAFDLHSAEWLTALVTELADATFYFERAIAAADQTAMLWRAHGHHASGQRVRLIGSSLFGDGGDELETVIDFAAMRAQLNRQMIDYG